MAQKRKLLVFVSSTFTDLKEERQAAVEAILKAGHIPAGMELFAATDKSQMDVIRKWIDESDAYLLLLGGRYGSIEPESGKSYTQLEYEYAVEKGKAFFSVVITEKRLNEKVSEVGKEVLELDNPQQYKGFRDIATSKMVEFWSDLRDIKLAIHATLSEFADRPELIGWVLGSEATNTGAIAEELVRLTKENAELRSQVNSTSKDTVTYNGLTFAQMYSLLNNETNIMNTFDDKVQEAFALISRVFGDEKPSLLHVITKWGAGLFESTLIGSIKDNKFLEPYKRLIEAGILDYSSTSQKCKFSVDGQKFYLRLKLERDVSGAIAAFEEFCK